MFGKVIPKGVRKILNEKRKDNERKLLRQNGKAALDAYFRVGEKTGSHFDAMFGTLLGIYRDHSFIPYDDDIDMVCNIKCLNRQLIDALVNEGFLINRIYVSSDRIGVP